jgi:hypothetical protein
LEDLVALKVTLRVGRTYGVMTWGRLVSNVEDDWLAAAFLRSLPEEKQVEVSAIHVCESLAEIQKGRYFFEGLFSFCQQRIPFGAEYAQWKAERRAELENGAGTFYVVGDL